MSQQDQQAYEQPLEKHRLEIEDYSVEFEDRLEAGEILASIESVSVIAGGGGVWVDVSPEFHISGEIVTDDTVAQFRMGEAGTDEQDSEPDYFVRVIVTTTNGRKLVSNHALLLSEQADPNAP